MSKNLYKSFESAWTNQLKHYELALDVLKHSKESNLKYLSDDAYNALMREYKNKIKRCRWNITRAKNLKENV